MVNFTHHNDIILTWVEPKGGVVTAWPNQIAIIMRDGKVTDVFTEGTRPVRPSLLSRSKVQAFIAYTAPFSLTFRLEDEYGLSDWEDGIPLKGVVLTADGHTVTAQFGLTFSVTPDKVDLLLRLSPTGRPIKAADVADAIKGELLAKVLTLDIRDYTAADLRGNETLLRSLYDSLRRELHSTLSGYGLQLDNFYANWGLTTPEDARLGEYQHQQRLREIERQQELQSKARQDEERREAQHKLEEIRVREEERSRQERLWLEEARVREETRVREEERLREEARTQAEETSRHEAVREAERLSEEARAREEARYKLFFQGVQDKLMRLGVTEIPETSPAWTWIKLRSPDFSSVSYEGRLVPDVGEAWVGVVFDSQIPSDNKELFNLLSLRKDSIEAELGTLIWVRATSEQPYQIISRLTSFSTSDDVLAVEQAQYWMADTLCAFQRVFETVLRWTDIDPLEPHRSHFYSSLCSRLLADGIDSACDEAGSVVVPSSVSWAHYRLILDGRRAGNPQATVKLTTDIELHELQSMFEIVGIEQNHRHNRRYEPGFIPSRMLKQAGDKPDIEIELGFESISANLPQASILGRYTGLQATEDWTVDTVLAFKSVFDPLMQTIEEEVLDTHYRELADRLKAQGVKVDEDRVKARYVSVPSSHAWISYYAWVDTERRRALVALYIEPQVYRGDRTIFLRLQQFKAKIQEELGILCWDLRREGQAPRVYATLENCEAIDGSQMSETRDWLADTLCAFKSVFDPLLSLPTPPSPPLRLYDHVATRLNARGVVARVDQEIGRLYSPTTISWISYQAWLDTDSHRAVVALYIEPQTEGEHLELFETLTSQKGNTELPGLGMLRWQQRGRYMPCRIYTLQTRSHTSDHAQNVTEAEEWMFKTLCAFRETFDPLFVHIQLQGLTGKAVQDRRGSATVTYPAKTGVLWSDAALYYVFTHPLGGNTSKLHKASCQVFNHGRGGQNSRPKGDDFWHGPYGSISEARASPKTLGPVSFCSDCLAE